MLAHRGPDGHGEWMDRERGIYLGHRRLAIIDLSDNATQPMTRNGLTVCYNGEIYNYRELRDELADRGAVFQTSSDTEVLLAAWEAWGPGSLDKFDGMFAFALYDGQVFHLATDPFGEKPLYWAQREEGVFFASEPGPLIRELGLSFVPSETESQLFLALGFLPAPHTGYPGLYQLPPATHAHATPFGLKNQRKYWVMPKSTPQKGRIRSLSENDLDLVHEVLATSIQRRLRADVPIGLFLSSGTDSALLAAIAKHDLGVALNSLTVSFSDGQDESQGAAAIARHLGIPHQIIDSMKDENTKDALSELVNIFGVPNDNLTALSVLQMSTLAKSRFTVALSGVGGDELFFGYNRHEWFWKKRLLYRLPEQLFSLLALPGLSAFPKIKKAHLCFAGDRPLRFLAVKNKLLGNLMQRLDKARKVLEKDFPTNGPDIVFQVRDFDINHCLPGSYIPAIERASMRAALEVRAPLLSRPLADLLSRFDARSLIADGRKTVLRRLLLRFLPRAMVDRPKQGFVYPAARFLSQRENVPFSVPGLDQTICNEIWQHQNNFRYSSLAARLSIFAHFTHE